MALPGRVWTIGHSTRDWAAFLGALQAHGIEAVADVRRFPASRKYPHFNQETMARPLGEAGIGYVHFPALGGRRPARPDSPNLAWRNTSFRGYADYMDTPEYRAGEQQLLDLCLEKNTAMMCAEAVWWRCHRGLIADRLKSQGVEVLHIGDAGAAKEHPYTGAASIVDGKLSYAGEQPRLL
jgi:uncharacterized protein (DUF488 family)